MDRRNRRLVQGALLTGVATVAAAAVYWPADASTAQPASAAPTTAVPDLTAPQGGEVDGVRHGTDIPHTAPADVAAFRAAHRTVLGGADARTGGTATPQTSIHPAEGTALLNTGGADGASAVQSVVPDLTVTNPGSTVYVPTIFPPGGACIEVTTRYVQGTREVAAWDWCGSINFGASVPIDGNFLAKYTNNDNAYQVQVVRTDPAKNTWTASLYDYRSRTWDTLFSSSGTSQGGNGGWDIYELYSDVDPNTGQSYVCADLKGRNFQAGAIKVRTGAGWTAAATGNADTHYDQPAANFDCPSMSYRMVNPFDHWTATG